MAANGKDVLDTIITLADLIGSLGKGIKKLAGIWKKKSARVKKVIPPPVI